METNLRPVVRNARADGSDTTTGDSGSSDGRMGQRDAADHASRREGQTLYRAEHVEFSVAPPTTASWESPAMAAGSFSGGLDSAGGDSPSEDMEALQSGLTPDGHQGAEVNMTTIHRDAETSPSFPLSLAACPQPGPRPHTHLHRDTETTLSSTLCPRPQPHTSQLSGISQSTQLSSDALNSSGGSAGSAGSSGVLTDSSSLLSAEAGDDNIFRKCEDAVTCGAATGHQVSLSCCSTAASCVEAETHSLSGAGKGSRAPKEEAEDRVTEAVPTRRPALLLRCGLRSLSPLRRHSWGPGKNGNNANMNQRSALRSPGEGKPSFHRRSYSLEGLSAAQEAVKGPPCSRGSQRDSPGPWGSLEERGGGGGSLVSLTEEQEDAGEHGHMEQQRPRRSHHPLRHSCPPLSLPLTKSKSMISISHKDTDACGQQRRKRRISFSFNLSKAKSHSHIDSPSSEDEDRWSMRPLSATGSLDYSICEEDPGPLRSLDLQEKTTTKVGRTFSYLRSKMYKKSREKDRETKDKKAVNGHVFTAVSSGHAAQCTHCSKAFSHKDVYHCTYCQSSVHKSCRESLPGCAKVRMKFTKQQLVVPDCSSIAAAVTMRNKSSGTRDRPWSAIFLPDDHASSSSLAASSSRRHASMMITSNLSKSLSVCNIAGPVLDEMPAKSLRYLSLSTETLNRSNQTHHETQSIESLTDEGTEMVDGQLMGEFEADVKDLEADSWSLTVGQGLIKHLDAELIKRQDVIYELMQTELHHVRTLRIMSEVYRQGLQRELALEPSLLERLFPMLDDLLTLHSQQLHLLLDRRRDQQLRQENTRRRDQQDGEDHPGSIVDRIGDVLLHQFSGSRAELMKRVYGKFCSRHNEAVNLYKELLSKDKRFQAFIKRKMSSSAARRLGIPECILLVTQRITKYPSLLLRMLQHTTESDVDHPDLVEAVRLVKEVITAVDERVNQHEKKQRLKDIHARTDSRSIMRMRSGQMFAREDLLRGRRHVHDGPLQMKTSQGRLKDVHAVLLSDVFVLLQEKDQKYIFASLDQRSTVLSLQKLLVRGVANEERGLFLISAAGSERPEMLELLAQSPEQRNQWVQLIHDQMASHQTEKEEDEGIPSESEDDKRQLENKAKEMRERLRQKDHQIVSLLQEKARVFREMCECGEGGGDAAAGAALQGELQSQVSLFRAASGSQEALPCGEPIMTHVLQEVEALQALVNGSLGGAMALGAGLQDAGGGAMGPVSLPRRAETFGGFDSHQMNAKGGDREESGDTVAELRRTESDGVLKKGGNANLLLLLKRNSEQVLHSVSHLHDLLSALQAVVVRQDSVIEDQRQVLVSSPSSRPGSLVEQDRQGSARSAEKQRPLVEQEKQRSAEQQRMERASLQRQQETHAQERRRREEEWERRERELRDREVLMHVQEEETGRRRVEMEREREELRSRKEEYQRDLERLRDDQRRLDRERDRLQRETDRMHEGRSIEIEMSEAHHHHHLHHPVDSELLPELLLLRSSSPELGKPAVAPPTRKSQSLPRGRSLNPFTSSSSSNQMPGRLLQLANRNRDKKKKKKKIKEGKGAETTDALQLEGATLDGEMFFC